jgi:hypothetical protein
MVPGDFSDEGAAGGEAMAGQRRLCFDVLDQSACKLWFSEPERHAQKLGQERGVEGVAPTAAKRVELDEESLRLVQSLLHEQQLRR